MPAELVPLNDGPSIILDKPILLLGRHPECDIQIDSRKVSRRHCCIAQVSDYLVVRDLDSTNGIRINGVRVQEGKLQPGDELTIGHHRYQVRWADHDEPLPRAAAMQAEPARRPVAPAEELNDEALEECEDPVPLAEPDDFKQTARAGLPLRPPASPSPPEGASVSPPAVPDSIIIPDEIRLAPGSKDDLGASHSHH